MKKPRRRRAYDDTRYLAARAELKRTQRVCVHCGMDIDPLLKWPHPLSWSADHIVPKSKLTPDDPRNWHISNLAASHLIENISRGNKPMKRNVPPLDW